jgi:glucosamine--fructose-6-phosphate aminotransferase (isomerizing)
MNHMLDEIRQQPEVVRHIIENEYKSVQDLAQDINLRNIKYAAIAARGTSNNAAVYAKYVLEIQHGIPTALAAPSAFTLYETYPQYGPEALVIGISQSGAAPDVIQVLKCARSSGALTVCITNEPESELAKVVDHVLCMHAGEEVGVAATKTYTGSLAMMALLSSVMDDSHPERIVHLQRAADAMEKTLNHDDAMHQLVERYKDITECVVLGRGFNMCTAYEVALLLTETCYISARQFSGADFQHGPIAQVHSGYPCLMFAPDGKAFKPMMELANLLKNVHPALICFAHDAAFLSGSETAVRIPAPLAEWVSPLVYAVAGQLFAYWLAVAKGNDPDTPRRIAKLTKTV